MNSALINAVRLDIGYAKKRVAQQLDISLHAGRIVALLGPNGTGKTTLFKTLLGLLPPLSGKVYVQGQRLHEWPLRELAHCLAYVPQAQDSSLSLSVQDMVLLGRTAHVPLFSSPSAQDRSLALQSLEALGIKHLATHAYDQLSGGEKQLVLIARALAQSPAALIMDEPTASLDFGNQIKVLKHMRRLADAGMGILFCTHQPEHALRIADEVSLFKDGAIQAHGAPQQILSPERIAWLYDLEPADLDVGHQKTPPND